MYENAEDKNSNKSSLVEIDEETDQELLTKLQSSEIDIDEFVIRSIRKTQKKDFDETNRSSVDEIDFADVYTINSKFLPSLTDTFQPHLPQETEIQDFNSLTCAKAIE